MGSWKRARFGDAEVWIEVDARGEPKVEGGRVPMRYSRDARAKVYRAGASRIQPLDAPIEELPDPAGPAGASRRADRGSGFGKAGTRTQAQATAAAEEARTLLASLPPDTVIAFTDGACKGNPGPAGAGALVQLPDGRTGEWARSLGRGTNNVAELTAIAMALELLDEADVPPDARVVLLSDSSYARGVLTQGWKARANRELVEAIRERLAARPGVELHWIAGHVGVSGNERADALANMGVAGRNERRWSVPR